MSDEKGTALSVPAKVEVEKGIAEIQALFTISQAVPRDIVTAKANILEACKDKELADKGLYSYPRGTTTVEGPSIKLMEEIALHWGRLRAGWQIIDDSHPDKTQVRAYCLDIQTLTIEELVFWVKHIRLVNEWVNGKKTAVYKQLTDDRDIYELVANMAARRKRKCIEGCIPHTIKQAAVEQVKRTIVGEGGESLAKKIEKMIAAFGGLGIAKEKLEKKFNRKVGSFEEAHLVQLRGIYNSLNTGQGKVEQFFPEETPNASVKDVTEPAPKRAGRPAKEKTPKATTPVDQTGLDVETTTAQTATDEAPPLDVEMTKPLPHDESSPDESVETEYGDEVDSEDEQDYGFGD